MAEKKEKFRDLPQVPKNQKSDGLDVEFAEELADLQDREAISRSAAADKRVKERQKNKKASISEGDPHE